MNTHYHGGPMWGGEECFNALYKDRCALVSYARPQQLKKIVKIAKSVVLDNGAFSTWKRQKKSSEIMDWDAHWTNYYLWVVKWIGLVDWFVIPDVIEGTEEENDRLVNRVPSSLVDKAVPVWHSVESLDRLVRLCKRFDRVAIGLCGPHRKTMSHAAQERLTEAFTEIYIKRNLKTKMHGMRMLDGRVLGKFPLDSGDSSFVAVNVPKTKRQMVQEQRKLNRTVIYRSKIECVNPPSIAEWVDKMKGRKQEIQLEMVI